MSSLSQIAYTGLHAAQLAMTSTGQNIANVNTPGFSRVGAVSVSLSGHGKLSPGAGVQVTDIRRFYSDYQNQQLWRANTEMHYFKNAQQHMSSLEALMSGDGSSISTGLDQFFAALSELTTTPESIALRQQVMIEAHNLGQRFNSLSGNIDAQIRALREQPLAMSVEINGLTDNIAELNRRIVETESVNGDSKSLRDHRETLVKELSQYATLRVNEVHDGSLTVALANGQPLVAGGTAARFEVTRLANGEQEISLAFGSTSFPLVNGNLGGALGGLYAAEYGSLRPMIDALHDMAGGLEQGVNAALAGGFDLHGNPGQPLFIYDPNSITAMLTVADIAASELALSGAAGEVGNNDVLLQMLDLRNSTITLNGNQVTLNDAFAGLLGDVASVSRQNQADMRSAVIVVDQAQAQRDSISAVNLDEEAVNLMTYQQAYQANMKVISTANQLFDSLLAAF